MGDKSTHIRVSLKNRREAAGLSQAALARQIGLSRQALSAVESGRQTPSVAVALALSRALRCRVEDVFALAGDAEHLAAELGSAAPVGARAVVAEVEGRWVAHALGASDYASSDGLVDDVGVTLHGRATSLAGNVLLAGCAPPLITLARRASEGDRGVHPRWLPASSGRALEWLAQGRVHVAGVHFGGDGELANAAAVQARFADRPMLLMNLLRWRQGLVVAPGNPLGLGPAELGRQGLRVAWREEGAGARTLLVSCLEGSGVLPGDVPGPVVQGHLEVAAAVATGAADVGVSIEAAALAHGLDFIPLREERFDLVLSATSAGRGAVQRLLDVVDSRAFRRELGAFGGYETAATGESQALEASA